MALSDDVQKLIKEGTCPNCGGDLHTELVVYNKTYACGKRCGFIVSYSEARQGSGGGGGNTPNDVPVINSINPATKIAGQAGFVLEINGSNFLPKSVVKVGAAERVTTYVSGAQLTAAILTSDLVAVGSLSITVYNPPPSGGTSNVATLSVLAAPDTTPPVISNIHTANITQTGATITWNTDELATSVVEYGLTNAYGSTVTSLTLVANHSRALTGLTANTIYHYRVKSSDAAGNQSTSADGTFTTAAAPPSGLALYGAGAYPYNDTVGPVGGGSGYKDIISPSLANYTPTTKAGYKAALADMDGADGRAYLYLPVVIDCTGEKDLHQRGGTIYGPGGLKQKLLSTPHVYKTFQYVAAGGRVTQITFEGPDLELWRPDADSHEVWIGLQLEAANCVVDNVEGFGWPYAFVTCSYATPRAQVHNCNIHHCCRMGLGYGVAGGDFYAWANKFDYCRHCITGNRGTPVSNWKTRWNEYGSHCDHGQSEDMHGGNDISDASSPAGGTIDSAYNTYKNVSGGVTPVSIRGVPTIGGTFDHEWFYDAVPPWALKELIYQSCGKIGGSTPQWPWNKLTATNIWTGTTPPPTG